MNGRRPTTHCLADGWVWLICRRVEYSVWPPTAATMHGIFSVGLCIACSLWAHLAGAQLIGPLGPVNRCPLLWRPRPLHSNYTMLIADWLKRKFHYGTWISCSFDAGLRFFCFCFVQIVGGFSVERVQEIHKQMEFGPSCPVTYCHIRVVETRLDQCVER